MFKKSPSAPEDPIDKYYSRIVMLFVAMGALLALLAPLATIGLLTILKAH